MTDSHLHLVGSTRPAGKPGSLPPPLRMLRDRAERHFSTNLKTVFEQVDDTFFDLADSAESNSLQTHYFDAMRLIRVERKVIDRTFVGIVSTAFDGLANPAVKAAQPVVRRDSGSFELIEDDALEEIIALDTMVSKAEEHCRQPLQTLTRRLDSLSAESVTDKSNPLGPDMVCDAFFKAVEGLDIGIRSKLVLMKLFDRNVIANLPEFLNQSNQLLIELGVLPDIDAGGGRDAASQASTQERPRTTVKAQSSFTDGSFYSTDSPKMEYGRLVAQLNAVLARQQAGGTKGADDEGGNCVELDDVVNALTSLQVDSLIQGERGQEPSLLEALSQQLYTTTGLSDMRSGERGVIQLVDSLFERVRREQGFSQALEPEMRGLEMAIMKVALKDPSFFDRARHPARRLLNEVAQASIGFGASEPLQQDPLYQKIHQVLEQLQSVAADEQVLTRLLTDFIAFVEKERRRSTGKEQRLLEEETAKARLNFSHGAVKKELNFRLLGLELPKITVSFAEQAWGNVMFLSHLREGPSSDAWRASLQVLDQIVDLSVLGHEAFSLRQAMELLESVRAKLDETSLDPYQTEHLIRGVEQLLQAGVAGAIDKLERVQVESVYPNIPGEPDEEPEPEEALEVEESHMHDVESIDRGTWVEFQTPDQGSQRARFAGLVGPSQRLIFVNRSGDKVVEGSRHRMAVALKNESLVVLDNSPMFDRALSGIVKDVRDGKNPIV